MKKILYVILCCLFMTAAFTGCGGNEKSASGAAKHLNLGLYWFGESMDPAHEWGWLDYSSYRCGGNVSDSYRQDGI